MGVLSWPEFARLVRGNVMSIRKKEYVEAARAIGSRDGYLLFRHVLPNAVGPIIVAATFRVAGAILQESQPELFGHGRSTAYCFMGQYSQWCAIYYGVDYLPVGLGPGWRTIGGYHLLH